MKKRTKIILALIILLTVICAFTISTYALDEDDVKDRVDDVGREAVTGNILVWFLCAIAFLKISHKIDSFMSAIGISVGRTSGSMLMEAMITIRGISGLKNVFGSSKSGYSGSGSGGSGRTNDDKGFMRGGLAGIVSRSFTNGAVKNATDGKGGGLGGAVFSSSIKQGGSFANNVIGRVATGTQSGSISGKNASVALSSYMGQIPSDPKSSDTILYSNVEMGGGRITATETSATHPDGIAIGMYSAEKYAAPDGEYTKVTAADGSKWYKQYAVDTVERKPYKAPDGSIAYNESIIKKMPPSPARKDKL